MNGTVLHRAPRWRTVFGEQLRSVGIANQREMLAAGFLLLVYGAVHVYVRLERSPSGGPDLEVGQFALMTTLLALFVPMSVWKFLEPSRRRYFWAMPVNRMPHSLIRVFAGWIWLMGLAAMVVLAHLGILAITGGLVTVSGIPWSIENNAWYGLLPFTAPTVAYLLASIVVLSSDFPWRWYAGIVAGFVGLARWQGVDGSSALGVVVDGRYGVVSWLAGRTPKTEWITVSGRPFENIHYHPDPRVWATGTALWAGIALAGVLLAAYRYQEG